MIEAECRKQKEAELEYQLFCTYSEREVLGVEVQEQYLYLVQPSKISVYEYHGKSKPLLIEEMIYNKPIKNYCINQHYICIQSQSLIEVRDRSYWVNLICAHPLSLQSRMALFLEAHDLYVSSIEDQHFSMKRINLLTKQIAETIDLGKVAPQKEQDFAFIKRPIFLKEMGAIQDFYIWGKDSKTVELGMLYVINANHKGKYEINQIHLRDHMVLQVYHHKISCPKYPRQAVQYAILVAQNLPQQQIVLCFIEILPKNRQQPQQQAENSSFQDLINQFSYLGKLNPHSHSLINEMLSDVLAESYSKKPENESYFEVKLGELKSYQQSFYKDGKIWVSSADVVCEIELKREDSIENLMRPCAREQERIVHSIQYLHKHKDKKGIGIYKSNLLFSEHTISLLVRVPTDDTQSIAEEIIQSPEFEENPVNPSIPKQTQDIEELCNNIIECALQETQKQSNSRDSQHKMRKPMDLDSNVVSQHHALQLAKRDCEIQTDPFINKNHELQEVQLLVAKYSSAFNASCVKIKQNHFQKEKFQKEILNIVDIMTKDLINPFLQQHLASLLQAKIREISQSIANVLHSQLQNLNETMRKTDVKQGHLRGKRIFEYSRQIQNMKGSVGEVMSALKDKQVNKFSFNELILAEAEGMKDKVKQLQRQISAIATRSEVAEAEVSVQIAEVVELMNKLCSKEDSFGNSDSDSEMDESDNECSQGQEGELASGDSESQKPQSFQELNQEPGYHYYHPQYNARPHRQRPMGKLNTSKRNTDSAGYPTQGYPSQFMHPYQYPRPYYLPYGPRPINTPDPFQSYFYPPHPFPPAFPKKVIPNKPKAEKQKKRP